MTTTSSAAMADGAYADLEQELAITRRMLERFPSGQNEWRPHQKSTTLAKLAGHVAELPGLGTMIITTDEWDFAKAALQVGTYGSAAELLATFDENVDRLRATLATFDAGVAATLWTLRNGEHVILAQPKGALIRSMVISHLIHHRAQLGVYYRMLDIPLPRSYGPSADEA